MNNVLRNKRNGPKQTIRIFAVFLLMFVCSSLLCLNVHAEETPQLYVDGKKVLVSCPLCGETHDFMAIYAADKQDFLNLPGGREFAYYINCWAYGDIFINPDPFRDSNTLDIDQILRFDVSHAFAEDEEGNPIINEDGSVKLNTQNDWGDMFSVTNGFYNIMSVFGALIVFIYFLIDLSDEYLMRDGFTIETFCKRAISTIAILFIIKNGMFIMQALMEFSTACVDILLGSGTRQTIFMFPVGQCVYDALKEPELIPHFTIIAQLARAFFPAIINFLVYIILRISIYGRVVDIVARVLFAPIGMSDMAHGGLRSNGVKYLKKLLSSCLQGVLIIVVVMTYKTIALNIQNSLAGVLGVLLVGLATITAIKQTQNVAQDVIGG